MQDLTGKIMFVTGATSGIGYHIALALAERGAHVVVGARNDDRGQQALRKMRQAAPQASLEYLAGDLSSMEQVRQVAADYLERHARLDVLVNNVGGFFPRRLLSGDGYEKTFALNHLSYFLLTNLLLDCLLSSAPARVVNVASASHREARIHFDDLQLENGYGVGLKAYGQSKLANVLFTYELDRRLEGQRVTSNALHPGFVRTGLPTKHMFWPLRVFAWLAFLFGMSPEEGAQTPVKLAAGPALEGVSGKYFRAGREVRSSPRSYDEQTARRLWEISEQLTGLR